MKRFLMTLGGIVLIIILLVGSLALLRKSYSRPSVILTSNCDAPCWNGITPGQTGSWDVHESLYEIEGISEVGGEYSRDEKLERYTWYFNRPIEDSGGSVWFDGERVMAIEILSINSLDLEDLFEKLGDPETYAKVLRKGEQREYLDVLLLYPSKGCLAEVLLDTKPGSNTVQIKPGTGVFRVAYFEPEKFYELMNTKVFFDVPVNINTLRLEPWAGYGEIAFERE
ncbi:MAG: hypothetical protein KBF64_06620 [Anaerolineaceae bacterium]|nr:hypothetical protein [Anaerolineaceae bacterium]